MIRWDFRLLQDFVKAEIHSQPKPPLKSQTPSPPLKTSKSVLRFLLRLLPIYDAYLKVMKTLSN
jgi:hypothetical protein